MLAAVLGLTWACALTVRGQQAGRIDPSFGASLGLVDGVNAVLGQPDGKILVAGNFIQGIARLNADGGVDSAFNSGLGGGGESVHSIALQPDGKILIGGDYTNYNGVSRYGLARLNIDGSLDTSFDPGKGVQFQERSFGLGRGSVEDMAIQTDGKILIAGNFTAYNGVKRSALARVNPDGSLDTSFDPGTLIDSHFASIMAVQADGKVLVSGDFFGSGAPARYGLLRLNADGTLDAAFQLDGALGSSVNVTAIAVQPDGQILAEGTFEIGGTPVASLVRLNANGSLDGTFHLGTTSSGTIGGTIALEPDGKIVAVIVTSGLPYLGGAINELVRLNADGNLDPSFASGHANNINTVAIAAGGAVIAAGQFNAFNGSLRNGVARLGADGSLDATFQPDTSAGLNGSANVVILQPDGKTILLGEFSTLGGIPRNGIARVNPDGSLDAGFDPGAVTPFAIGAVTLQPDGKMIVTGNFVSINGLPRVGIARLNPDGSLDTSFSSNNFPGPLDRSSVSVIVQPDGKILVFFNPDATGLQGLTRLNPDGSVDATFHPNTEASDFEAAAIIQPDGKIIIGGAFSTVNGVARNGIARLNADGSLDTGFIPQAGDQTKLFGLALQSDGQIIVLGQLTTFGGVARNQLARLNSDGSLDLGYDPTALPDGAEIVGLQSNDKLVLKAKNASGAEGTLVRLNTDGNLDTTFASGIALNGDIDSAQVQADDKIVVGGLFNSVNSVVRNDVARFNADGTLDMNFIAGPTPGSIAALVLQADDLKVLTGGSFTELDGTAINALARLNPDGSLDGSFAPGFGSGDTVQALALEPDDGDVFVAALETESESAVPSKIGSRPHAQAKVQNHLHRCAKTNGARDHTFAATTDGATYALLGLPGRRVLIGGSFANVNGVPHAALARLASDGTVDPGFVGTADAAVRALAAGVTAGQVLVVGDFASVDGVPRSHVARLNADGSLDQGFDPGAGPNGSVNALKVLANGQILIGGNFTSVAGVARGGVARLNTDGRLDLSFVPGANTLASPSVAQTGKHRTRVMPRDGAAAVTEDNAATAGTVLSLDTQPDGKVIIGGLFDALGGTPRHNVARLLADGSVDATFDPGAGPDAAVNALQLQPGDGRTLLGGAFSTVGGLARRGAARLLGDPSVVSVTPKIAQLLVPPGKAAKFIVSRVAGADTPAALTINFALVGSAIAGVDYLPPTSGGTSVVLAAGQTSVQVKVKLLAASQPERRVIKLKLKPGDGYVPSTLAGAAQAKVVVLPAP